MAIGATLAHTSIDAKLVGHVVMGLATHSHRDSIYGAQGMRWRGGLGNDVPALTVARICGSGAEAVAVGMEMILAGVRHDEELVGGDIRDLRYHPIGPPHGQINTCGVPQPEVCLGRIL